MHDSSPSSHGSSTSSFPSRFSFDIDQAVLTQVVTTAERFAPIPRGDYSVAVRFTPGSQRWIIQEHNCTAWITSDDSSGPETGTLVLPLHFLVNLTLLFSDVETFPVLVDFSQKNAIFQYGPEAVITSLPHQECDIPNLEFVPSSHVVIPARALLHLGSLLANCPVDIGENAGDLPLPFCVLEISGFAIKATRNWGAFGGATTSLIVEAHGDFAGVVSYFPDPMNREMLFAELEEDGAVTLGFSTETPNIALMSSDNWAMRFELGFEHVYQYRRLIEGQLLSENMDVDVDERTGWNPTVRVRVEERLIDIDIVGGLTVIDATLRASTVVLVDAPWTLELASEVNAWNDQWASVKLVYQGASLFAVCDFPNTGVDHVSGIVRDLVAKAALVDQVIGVFL